MISNTNFRTAFDLLNRAVSPSAAVCEPKKHFEGGYKDQHVVMAALEILHTAVVDGTEEQKRELLGARHKIVQLNATLRQPRGAEMLEQSLGMRVSDVAVEIKGTQIAVPQNKWDKLVEIASVIPRVFATFLVDIGLLPGAGALIGTGAVYKALGKNFNPKDADVKKDKMGIVGVHGSSFNQTEWVLGRFFTDKKEYGSFFSFDLDGLVSNDPKMGIEDYARGKFRSEILRIKGKFGIDRFVFLGHSMGGLVAAYYAEHYAKQDGVTVEHVISIATPWQGTPSIDAFWKLGGCVAKSKETKRHRQMSLSGGTDENPTFRKDLVAQARESERKGIRKYYNIWSTTDYAVPLSSGKLTLAPGRQREFTYLGHYGLVAAPMVWKQAVAWLDQIYNNRLY